MSGAVALPTMPPVVLPLRVVAEEFGLLVDGSDDDSGSDVDMESYPLAARAAGRMGRTGNGPDGTRVGLVVLFPAVPAPPKTGPSLS